MTDAADAPVELTFVLVGDVRHPGTIRVTAPDLAAALGKADDYDFEVDDEDNKNLAFDWGGEVAQVLDADGRPVEMPAEEPGFGGPPEPGGGAVRVSDVVAALRAHLDAVGDDQVVLSEDEADRPGEFVTLESFYRNAVPSPAADEPVP